MSLSTQQVSQYLVCVCFLCVFLTPRLFYKNTTYTFFLEYMIFVYKTFIKKRHKRNTK